MSDPPPDAPPDVPVTPGRRLARAAGRFARPFLWALAGLGAAVVLFPRSIGGGMGEPDTMRELSRLTVDVQDGIPLGDAPPWHPRFVTVTVLGPGLPPDPRWPAEASAEEIESAGALSDLEWYGPANPRRRFLPAAGLLIGAGATRDGFYRQDADMLGGFFGGDPGPMCRVVGASISIWYFVGWIGLWGSGECGGATGRGRRGRRRCGGGWSGRGSGGWRGWGS